MDIITRIRKRSSANPKTIILPEYNDKRVVEAAKIIEKEGIAKVILLTQDRINPAEKERYIQEYYELRKAKGIAIEDVRKIFDDSLFYGAMMVRDGKADGFVAGASHTTADTARAAIHCLGIDKTISIACSCFIMVVPDCPYGDSGTFIYADCGIIPEPNPRQLACISFASAQLGEKVLGATPRVAFLSYSTRGSAQGKVIDKTKEGLKILKEMAPDLIADGEFQVDAAIVPEVAQIKFPDSPVGGKANILIFPDLESGNISYKLTQRLAKARAIGPLMMGLNKPCSDLSRGCSVDDVIDCVAVTSIRAQ
ncbi:MAG: phosphate acyltransferase [Candidatus Omnitrophica bacterium]|jgi:phosphate acetyltransferase|nr:phosphate acyltransferase [Candidatus Omnitrophota bacterium]